MRWCGLGVCLLSVLLATFQVASASADTYSVLACDMAPTGVNNSWEEFNSDPTQLVTGRVCPPTAGTGEQTKTTGMFASDSLGSSGAVPDGAIAGERFIAPAGTTISGFQDDRYLGAYADNGWAPFVKADGTTLETCTFAFPEEQCSVGGPFGSGSLDGQLEVDEASTITVGIQCKAVGGCTVGSTLHRAWAAMYGAKVILTAPAPPSIASPEGSFWLGGAANGYRKGTEQVSFHASDLTGISKASVVMDGHVFETQEGDCDYTEPLPCKQLNPAFAIDTTQIADGPHTLALVAYDAAGNERQIAEQIVVANQPPPAPLDLKAASETGGSFSVSWSDPPHDVPIIGATYQLCLSSGACMGSVSVAHDSPLVLPSSAAGQTVKVWLTDAAGNSASTNMAATTLPAAATGPSPGAQQLSSLRLRYSLKGRKLLVTVLVPAGFTQAVHVTVLASKRGKRLSRMHKLVSVKRGTASTVFHLSRVASRARVISIEASAKGAVSAMTKITLSRRSRRRSTH